MSDRAVLAEQVLGASFPMSRLSPGYREAQVDLALDELASRVRRGDDAPTVRAFVDALRFAVGRGRRSYDLQAVDELLERVVSELADSELADSESADGAAPGDGLGLRDATPEAPWSTPAATLAPPLPSAVVEHPGQGPFGRLFRRR